MKCFSLIFLVFFVLSFRVDAWMGKMEATEQFVSFMPSVIEPRGFVTRYVHTGIFNAVVADSCGVTAIGITARTADSIRQKGLRFLEAAKRSRKDIARVGGAVHFEDWRAMSGDSTLGTAESMIVAAFSCAGLASVPLSPVIEGLKGRNGYASSRGGDEFYVFPDQKLFVHAFID